MSKALREDFCGGVMHGRTLPISLGVWVDDEVMTNKHTTNGMKCGLQIHNIMNIRGKRKTHKQRINLGGWFLTSL